MFSFQWKMFSSALLLAANPIYSGSERASAHIDNPIIRGNPAIRRNAPFAKVIPRFNQALNQMKQEGTYPAILDRYFSSVDLRLQRMNEQ